MVLMVIGVFISFFQILSVGWSGLAIAIVSAAIEVYFFLCIYSLYDMFRSERLGGNGQLELQTQQNAQPYVYTQQPVVYAQQPVFYTQQPEQYNNQPQTTFHVNQEPVAFDQNTNPYAATTQPNYSKVPLNW